MHGVPQIFLFAELDDVPDLDFVRMGNRAGLRQLVGHLGVVPPTDGIPTASLWEFINFEIG